MAEGFLRQLGGERFDVASAGTDPVPINPEAVEAMAEIEIDISAQESKDLKTLLGEYFAYVITVCDRAAGEHCRIFPGAVRRFEWNFPDPAVATGPEDMRKGVFRDVRDQIGARVRQFLETDV